MADIIKQLSDRLANQIAAGEVIQRPASVVKELVENAVDAGATDITLIVKDAGKELIQVIDNGKGMSPIDARMCFERHATSKIRNIDDLFSIRTMGFRGEALASIAAVAQVELITATPEAHVGTRVKIDGGQFILQENTGSIPGTNFAIKNLFYNVPARRKFLKSNTSEFRHIYDEFVRIAMTHPDIAFKLIHQDTEQLVLRKGTLKSRVVDILGAKFDRSVVNIEEDTDYLKVKGFVGKPEVASRSKGNQYFFVNNRFIKSAYLHHAIANAFEGLIVKDEHPIYVLFLDIDPTKVDVNVHPTKQEVKFEDERLIYSFLKSLVTNVLARFNLAPSLDFNLDPEIQNLESVQFPNAKPDIENVSNGYLSSTFSKANAAHFIEKSSQRKDWEQARNTFFDNFSSPIETTQTSATPSIPTNEFIHFPEDESVENTPQSIMYWNGFLVSTGKSGLKLIHVQRAQERIAYDQLLHRYLYGQAVSQKLLFPEMIELNGKELSFLEELSEDLHKVGFEISSMGKNTVAVHSVPPELLAVDIKAVLDEIMEEAQYSGTFQKPTKDIEKLLRIAARKAAQPYTPSQAAHQALIGQLYACVQPEYSPTGGKIIVSLQTKEIVELFKL